MNGPVRTCIGCRDRAGKAQLVRLVWRESRIEVDARQVQPGRGAYLHPVTRCWDLAVRRRAVGRALRARGAEAQLLVPDFGAATAT